MKRCLMFALLGVVAKLHAAPLDFGNVAPREGRVELRVNGTLVGTPGYLDFGHVEAATGAIAVEARAADTGEVLAAETFDWAPESGITPILLLQGNGEEAPYDLHLYQNVYAEYSRYPADATGSVYVARHHVALLPEILHGEEVTIDGSQWCSGNNPGGFWTGGGLGTVDWYYGAMRGSKIGVMREYAQKECGLIVQGFFGSVRLAVPYAEQDTRLFFAGDGKDFPYTITAVREGGTVIASTGPLEPQAGPVIESEHVWYDLSRPAQAVALYPIVGTDALAAYWFTHDDDGESTWYFLDGTRTRTARYELAVYRATGERNDPIENAGSAELVFVDCNNAEIRMESGEFGLQTLRLRRSDAVLDCEVLDD